MELQQPYRLCGSTEATDALACLASMPAPLAAWPAWLHALFVRKLAEAEPRESYTLARFGRQETEDALAVASRADLIRLAKSSQRLFHVEQLPLRVWNRSCRLRFQSGHVGQDWPV